MTVGKQNCINADVIQKSAIALYDAATEYQQWVPSTVIYPQDNTDAATFYLACKLVGEAREYEQATYTAGPTFTECQLELFDTCWYAAMLCTQFKWNMYTLLLEGRIYWANTGLLEASKEGGFLCVASALMEPVGKLWRDGGDLELVEKNTQSLKKALSAFLARVEEEAEALGTDLAAILKLNQEKLNRRKDEGKLSGNGSDR